jgi:hypothetical protein
MGSIEFAYQGIVKKLCGKYEDWFRMGKARVLMTVLAIPFR